MSAAPRSAHRVAFVVGFLNSGGAERAALNMSAAAPRSDCHVVAEWSGGDLASHPDARGVRFASRATTAPNRIARIHNLARVLRDLRPDVVVSMLSPLVSVAAARLAGARVVHWLQAPWSETTAVTAQSAFGRVQLGLLRTAIRNSAAVAAATPGLCEECTRLGIPVGKLALLPNGLRLPAASRPPAGIDNGLATIVTVGRLEPPKRHDLTIRAFAALRERRKAKLVIVGSGRDEAQLQDLARQQGVADAVEFTGFVRDPNEHLRRADIFVLATGYEGFGNVIVEALAWGIPVVVSDVPYGPRFILDDGRYGTLVNDDSVESLAAALEATIDRVPVDAGTALGLRSRAESFSLERVAERFEDLIDTLQGGAREVPVTLREWT